MGLLSLASREFLDAAAVDLGHVNRSLRIDAEHVRQVELSGPLALLAPAAQRLALQVQDPYPVGPPIRQKQSPLAGQEQTEGSAGILPLVQKLPVAVEDLDAVVLAIADV